MSKQNKLDFFFKIPIASKNTTAEESLPSTKDVPNVNISQQCVAYEPEQNERKRKKRYLLGCFDL